MAFKSIKQIEQDKYDKVLRLDDDGKSVTGVLLYNSYDDVLVADVHYVNSKDYKGYVHCCGDGCPACKKGIRVQHKLFIPILVLADLNEDYDEDTVIFWDRNTSFNHQLRKEVFSKYSCPTDVVFKITRYGAYRDINTTYKITAKFNFPEDVNDVLSLMHVHFPEYYENIVRTVDAADLSDMINDNSSADASDVYSPTQNYSYQATPRKKFADPEDLDANVAMPGEEVELESFETPIKAETLPDFKSESVLADYKPGTFAPEEIEAVSGVIQHTDDDDDDCEPTF